MYHLKIHVYQPRVACTQSVGILAILPLVLVSLATLAARRTVDLSVQSTLNAPVTRLA